MATAAYVDYTPAIANALGDDWETTWAARLLTDPTTFAAHAKLYPSAKYVGVPIIDQLSWLTNLIRMLRVKVRNDTGSTIVAGPVAVIGYVTAQDCVLIGPASHTTPRRQATLILDASLATATTGYAYQAAEFAYNTTGATVGDPVYLGASAGTLTLTTAPSGADQFVQQVGRVVTVSASGVIAGRCLPPEKWGTSDLQAASVTLAKLEDGIARSVPGRAANSSGVRADIAPGAGKALLDRGSVLGGFYVDQRIGKTANYTVVADDNGAVVDCDTTSAGFTITLTAAATVGAGFRVTIRKTVSANLLTIDPNGSETINGVSTSQILTAQYSYITLVCNGTNWDIVGVSDYVEARVLQASRVSAGGTGVFTNITSISLGAGDWDVAGVIDQWLNGATCTASNMALSINSGNTTTDHVGGDNFIQAGPPTSTYNNAISIPGYRISLAATTTVYLKFSFSYSAGTPQADGRISARRFR